MITDYLMNKLVEDHFTDYLNITGPLDIKDHLHCPEAKG